MYEKQLQEAKDRLAALSSLTDPSAEELAEIPELQKAVSKLEALGETSVEIARSFSFKLNVGNYESRDFFCSQKAECKMKDAEQISEALYAFCKNEVMKSVNAYKVEATRTKTEAARSKEVKDIAKDEAEHEAGETE